MASVFECVPSFIEGRIRLRHPALRDPDLMAAAGTYLENIDGVTAVQRNASAGSLLIFYDPGKLGRDDVTAYLEQGAEILGATAGAQNDQVAGGPGRSGKKKLPALNSRKITNRVMLGSLLCSLAGIAFGAKTLHTVAGGVFALACLKHTVAHRKAL